MDCFSVLCVDTARICTTLCLAIDASEQPASGAVHFIVSNICAASDVLLAPTNIKESMSPRDNFAPAQPSRETAGYKKLLFVPDGTKELGEEGSGGETEHRQD